MATKKITLNELRSIVKQIIKEEEFGIHKDGQLDMFSNQKETDKLDRFSFKKHMISKDLLDWIGDAASDPEFQYDYKEYLTDDTEKNIDLILNNKKILKRLFQGFYSDVIHDIELELSTGEDITSLLELKHELKRYLTILNR